MPIFFDQLGRAVSLAQPPRRIVSLVPSQTELLYTLGLGEAVVGITKFCIRPQAWFRTKARIGGTKAVDPARVEALRPDLIIANREENEKPQVEALAARYPVWISDISTLDDALDMIRSIGALTGRSAEALHLATDIATRFQRLATDIATRFQQLSLDFNVPARHLAPPASLLPAVYLIWRDPYMAAGRDTFISHMLQYCGYTNLFADQDRYPSVDLPSLSGRENLQILLSSEPYPFRQRHIEEIKEILPGASIRLVDGEFFSWYGSRLLDAPSYFRSLVQ
jgi:ABC-type Fe3+-hydroxamate transport system substrate-binding protein